MHFLMYLIAVVLMLIGTLRYWFWLAPAYAFILQVTTFPLLSRK